MEKEYLMHFHAGLPQRTRVYGGKAATDKKPGMKLWCIIYSFVQSLFTHSGWLDIWPTQLVWCRETIRRYSKAKVWAANIHAQTAAGKFSYSNSAFTLVTIISGLKQHRPKSGHVGNEPTPCIGSMANKWSHNASFLSKDLHCAVYTKHLSWGPDLKTVSYLCFL